MYEELVESPICKPRNFKVNIVPISEIKLKYIYLSRYLSVCIFEYCPRTYSKPWQYNNSLRECVWNVTWVFSITMTYARFLCAISKEVLVGIFNWFIGAHIRDVPPALPASLSFSSSFPGHPPHSDRCTGMFPFSSHPTSSSLLAASLLFASLANPSGCFTKEKFLFLLQRFPDLKKTRHGYPFDTASPHQAWYTRG